MNNTECLQCDHELDEIEGVSDYPGLNGVHCQDTEIYYECEKCKKQYQADEDGLYEI